MTDVLIRNVPESDLKRIDEHASRLGISRSDYLRRQIAQDAARQVIEITFADLERFADKAKDLLDDAVMRDAWS